MTLAELLASRPHVLLDFDGPVCAVFGGVGGQSVTRGLAKTLRVRGVELPADLAASDDPFAVLRQIAATAPDLVAITEERFRELEVEAVARAPMTPGLRETLAALAERGRTVTIVSNNSGAAVQTFLDAHDLTVHGVVARTEPDPSLLKPSPHLVSAAVRRSTPSPSSAP
jgi:phosphoglycolate phosphatase